MYGLCFNDFNEMEDIVDRISDMWFPDPEESKDDNVTTHEFTDDDLPF